ncbi:hypothetical protein [Paenibacillus sp. MBLB4367]|uniref:hypothetical protein n=1 Tax=Paenibacillus sp. MBLB4367 TaxID=3384767 RepID=UPI003908047C
MTFWRNVRWLLRGELRRIGFGFLWTMIMMVYFAFFGGTMLFRYIGSAEHKEYVFTNVMIDFIFLTSVGMMGFAFSKDYLKYWKNNRLSSKMKYYKSLPISSEEIVVCRQLTLFITTVFSGLVFFISLYLMTDYVRTAFEPLEYVAFALAWTGYSLILASFFLYVELGYKEKIYFIISCSSILLYMGVPVLLWLLDAHAVQSSIRVVKETGFVLPAITLLLGAASQLLLKKFAVTKLNRRNLT